MIHQTRFPYGTSQLLIRSHSELPDTLASDISRFVSFSSEDLNPIVKDTSAYRFNNAKVGLPIDASPEFVKFLHLLFELQKINPESQFFNEDLAELNLVIDTEKNKILKSSDITFNARGTKTPFVIDSVKNFLVNEKGFDDFLVIYGNQYNSSGDSEWRIEIPELSQGDQVAELGIVNSAIVLSEYDDSRPKTSSTKFGHIPLFHDPEFVVINADSLTKAHILSDLSHSMVHDLDFHNFAMDSNSKVMVKTRTGDIHSFPLNSV
jgi:thiamine biosynthesis lipoprotein ApbE